MRHVFNLTHIHLPEKVLPSILSFFLVFITLHLSPDSEVTGDVITGYFRCCFNTLTMQSSSEGPVLRSRIQMNYSPLHTIKGTSPEVRHGHTPVIAWDGFQRKRIYPTTKNIQTIPLPFGYKTSMTPLKYFILGTVAFI